MFQYVFAFLLINTYYQSLGNPIQSKILLSKPLTALANQCASPFLTKNIKSVIEECSVYAPPYNKKQYQCLIFYDINMQLCSEAATSKLLLNEDNLPKLTDNQDVNSVCTVAKDWVFTNISDFANYKETAEKLLKLPATCGEVCGLEDTIDEANYFCKYYKWGIEILKSQAGLLKSTVATNTNNDAVSAPISELDVNTKLDMPLPDINNSLGQDKKTSNDQIKNNEPGIARTTPHKVGGAEDDVVKPDISVQVTPKQTSSFVESDIDKSDDDDVNVKRPEKPAAAQPDSLAPINENNLFSNTNKSTVVISEKFATPSNIAVPQASKNIPVNADPKETVLDQPKPKPVGDTDDYADSDVNETMDDEGEEQPGLDVKDQDGNRNTLVRNKLVMSAHEVDNPQKEYFPNTIPDGFSEDSDHFFPFFMTAIILMVLLYILYHNKNKVSKLFFGLLLEGRQNGRRRNSRGHSYRRLDTLEQAMSANTAAPPSKIIY